MEFLAKYGPLRQLDHHGWQTSSSLNVFQFYLIDIIGAVLFLVGIIAALTLYAFAKIVKFVAGALVLVKKLE